MSYNCEMDYIAQQVFNRFSVEGNITTFADFAHLVAEFMGEKEFSLYLDEKKLTLFTHDLEILLLLSLKQHLPIGSTLRWAPLNTKKDAKIYNRNLLIS